MKKMLVIMVAAVVVTLLGTSCSTITPESAGIAAGTAAYLGYQHVAANKDDEFKQKVADIWKEVNEIETTTDLVSTVADLTIKFDGVLNDEKLTPTDKAVLLQLKNIMLAKVSEAIDSKFSSESDAIKFLIGARQGVNDMIELEKSTTTKKE